MLCFLSLLRSSLSMSMGDLSCTRQPFISYSYLKGVRTQLVAASMASCTFLTGHGRTETEIRHRCKLNLRLPAFAEIVVVVVSIVRLHSLILGHYIHITDYGTFLIPTTAIYPRIGVSATHSSFHLIAPVSPLSLHKGILPRLRSSAGPRFNQSKNTSN